MKMLKILPLAALMALGGCYKVTFTNGPSAGELKRENGGMHAIGIFGLVEFASPVPVHSMCPGGFERVDVRQNVITGILGNLTGNLFTPTQTFVQCASGRAYILGIDEQGSVAEALELEMAE